MGISLSTAAAYIGKQSAKGTPVTPPEYGFLLTGGKPFNHDITQDVVPLTGTSPGNGEADRTMIVPTAQLNTLGYPRSLGRLLFAILGQDTMSPAGTHTMVPIVEPLSYNTLWGRLGSDYVRIQDAKPNQVVISFDSAGLVKVESAWMGTTSTWATTPSAATVDDTAGGITKLRAAGGTFQLDIDGVTLATYCVRSGSVTINRNLAADPCAASATPNDVTAGRLEVSYSLTIAPASDLVDVRNIVTGAPAGTAPTGTPPYGSVSISFLAGTDTLTLASTRVAFLAETPDADPAGGTGTVVLEGTALTPTSGSQISAVLVNSVVLAY
jgi:tail tube protein